MLSQRAKDTTPFIVMDIMERAQALEAAGRDVVHLEVGEPDFAMPAAVTAAVAQALAAGATHYSPSLGIAPLREAISAYYRSQFGLAVDPGRIIVTAGTSGAFLLLFAALFETGDDVLFADPGYPCYPNFARFVGATPVAVPVGETDGFALDPAAVRACATPRTRALVVSSPANPTGAVTSPAAYRALAEATPCLISDEIYQHLGYDGTRPFTALQVSDEAIVIDGFSKRFAMTGLRVGWMVVPERLVRPIQRLSQNVVICVTTPAQYGAVAALGEAWPDVRRMVGEYAKRRARLVAGLQALGFGIRTPPAGAFYIFARTSGFAPDSFAFCERMLAEAGVAATPGLDFGQNDTRAFTRFSYTTGLDRIELGLDRLRMWLRR